ncbi:MAG: transposase, partial [Candidatus Omnitrophica bacterium]|nr:transposase [Candidatus Omnitrophota bacterium]
MNEFGLIDDINRKQTLSSFVAGFKSAVTKRINMLRNTPRKPIWQRSFHDHIIRNDKSLYNILEYIINNSTTWGKDENNPNNKNHNIYKAPS